MFGIGTLVGLAASWTFAGTAAEDAYDRLLASTAVQMIDSVEKSDQGYVVNPPDSVFDTLRLAEDDRFFYAVRGPRGELLTGYPDLPRAAGEPVADVAKSNAIFLGTPVRMITEWRYLGRGSTPGWVTVTVAQTKMARQAMQLKLFARHAPITIAITALGLLASLFAARLAVRPLAAVEQTLAGRHPQDLTPIDDRGPAETAALVAAINMLMQRLEQRLVKLQQFAALAAHQLRTPLTALSAQIDLLAHEEDESRRTSRIERLRLRLSELNRLIHQLLGHAMIAYRGEMAERQPVDLVNLSRSVVLHDDSRVLENGLELQFVASHEWISVQGDAVMLREAIANLVNNAAVHGARRQIKVCVLRDGDGASLTVADDGDGLPPKFWKDTGTPFALKREEGLGSGLGLSIVHEIAGAHGATVEFGRDVDGLFQVSILFPECEAG